MALPADNEGNGQPGLPWFSGRSVDVVVFRVNRRPLSQGHLFAKHPESFIDHLAEVLLFGHVVRVGRRGNRQWQIGNRRIDPRDGFVAGILGWETPETHDQDYFDHESAEWVPSVVTGSRVALAPFSIEITSRQLFVVRHATFREAAIASVFRSLLNAGEKEREFGATTDWDVQPLLEEGDFEDWLHDIEVLDKVTFVAKLPNPDAEEAFLEIQEHLDQMRAGLLTHTLKAADPEVGLSKQLQEDRLSNGLLEMSKRGYASVSARAQDAASRIRHFVQKNRTKRQPLHMSSENHNDARDELAGHTAQLVESEDG